MKVINVLIITNTTVEIYLPELLSKTFAEGEVEVKTTIISVEQVMAMKGDEVNEVNIVVVLLDAFQIFSTFLSKSIEPKSNFEQNAKEIITICNRMYVHIGQVSTAPILWFGFEDYQTLLNRVTGSTIWEQGIIDIVNFSIYRELREEDVYIDFKRMIAELGISNSYDWKGYYRWNSLYSKSLISRICVEIWKQYQILSRRTKKCIVLDCDNVLWGGILEEAGIEGIILGSNGAGKKYQDFQRYVLELYKQESF